MRPAILSTTRYTNSLRITMPDTTLNDRPMTAHATQRRRFIRDSALAALAAGALAACRKGEAATNAVATKPTTPTPTPPAPLSPREKADAMDRMHEAGIKAFP